MSSPAGNPEKKHRHDIGQPDHGATSTDRITRAIQFLLAGTILATAGLLLWTVAVAG